jgi:hypothetical protein
MKTLSQTAYKMPPKKTRYKNVDCEKARAKLRDGRAYWAVGGAAITIFLFFFL